MALIRFHTCDHCGKQLDDMKDCPEIDINICYEYVKCDLCAECAERLVELVTEYTNGVKDNDQYGVTVQKRGEWRVKYPLRECGICGEIYSELGGNGGKAWDYCPNCGAFMRGKEE